MYWAKYSKNRKNLISKILRKMRKGFGRIRQNTLVKI